MKKICFLMLTTLALVSLPPVRAQSAPSTLPASTLLVRTDEAATVLVDGHVAGVAQAYVPFETPATPGNHLVSAVALSGPGRTDQAVQVQPGQRSIVLMDLSKIRLQQQQQASDQQQKAQKSLQQQQCRDQLAAKRVEAGKAMDQYLSEQQQASESAQLAQLNKGSSSGPQWLQVLNATTAGIGDGQAKAHQANAALWKTKSDQLNQQIAQLQTSCGAF